MTGRTGADDDTLTCREEWAERSAEPGTSEGARRRFCGYASVDASPECGDACALYCRTGHRVCGPGFFPPVEVCLIACRRRDDESRLKNNAGIYESGLRCRFSWLERAIADPRACNAASPLSPSPCGECQDLKFTYDAQ